MKEDKDFIEMGRPGISRRTFMERAGVAALGVASMTVVHAEAHAIETPSGVQAMTSGKPISEAIQTSLDGKWKLIYFPQGKHQIADPAGLKALRLTSIEAIVPGEAALDLSRHGELPADLFFGENILTLKSYELYEWWYQHEFPTPRGIDGRRLELRFQGVDCLASYWLNGKKLGETANALIEHRFDVTGKLNSSAPNVLTIRLRSPIIEAAGKTYDPSDSAVVHHPDQVWIRKAAHSFGWDIMPRAISAGLWRPVDLIAHAPNEITDIHVATESLDGGRAKLAVSYELTTDLALLPQLQLRVEGRCGNATFVHTEKLHFVAGWFRIEIANPSLWWPKGYGTPNLYEVTTQLLRNNEVIASRKDFVGIRKVDFIHHDAKGLDEPPEFLFKVNDVPILCKGSNWVPLDVFHSRDVERYQQVMDLAIDIGCNILRCWGGNVYEDHIFFDICDRNGIMVWQDFAMACALYPQTPEFLEVIREEAISITRKLRNHASLLLWCGDNECDMFYQLAGLDPGNNQITRKVLPQVVAQCDPYRAYLPSSPYMSPEVISTGNKKLMPETHLWGSRDYYKSQYYLEESAPFISEAGYYGSPGLSSLKRFLDDKHLWPWQDNSWWALHSTSTALDPVGNYRLANGGKELFGIIPDKLEDFILLTQITEAEAIKYFVERMRLNKWRTTGMIWWNLMAGWPQINVTVVDYYFNKKLAYYYIRRVQQPICIMVDEPKA
ncbi:MAG: hypothetical protein ABI164_07800 [Acidobacteriaceae bacterium]